jgi:hypothetical protein
MPATQHHDRDRHEAASRRHPLRERPHLRQHQCGPGEPAEAAAHDRGRGADETRADPCRAGHHRALSGGAQHETHPRPKQHPPRDRDREQSQIRRDGLVEQRRAQNRKLSQAWNRRRRERRQRQAGAPAAGRLAVERAGESDRAERDRCPRDDLVGARADRDGGERGRQQHPGQDAGGEARPRTGR